jgi:hypothetical protein
MADWIGRPHVALLQAQEEDRFTAYFAELLRDDRFREAFLNRLCGVKASSAEVPIVRTQMVIPGGRPDLVLSGPAHNLIFEAKVGSWLHGSQLIAYANALAGWQADRPGGVARLFLLAPASSAGVHGAEAVQQFRDTGSDDGHPIAVVTWQNVAALAREVAERSDLRLAIHLREFALLVEDRLGTANEPFTADEAVLLEDPTFPLLLERLLTLVGLTKEALGHLMPEMRLAASSGMGSHGFIIRRDGRAWWFGVFYPRWAAGCSSPVSMTLPGIRPPNHRIRNTSRVSMVI